MTLDDTIQIRHAITCRFCSYTPMPIEDAVFDSFTKWINHKRLTGHTRGSHTVSVVTDHNEMVFSFSKK